MKCSYMDIGQRNLVFVACEQQRRNSDCTSVQSDKRLGFSLSGK